MWRHEKVLVALLVIRRDFLSPGGTAKHPLIKIHIGKTPAVTSHSILKTRNSGNHTEINRLKILNIYWAVPLCGCIYLEKRTMQKDEEWVV